MTKGLVYYTDNTPDERIFKACQKQLNRCMEKWGFPIYSVSQKPMDFGINIVMDLERAVLSMFKQILRGLEECKTDSIFLIEHDVLYDPSHFDFTPEREDHFYYNKNMWHVSSVDGKAVTYLHCDPSHLCANRELLLRHYGKVVKEVETNGWHSRYGFSPPKGLPPQERIGHYTFYTSAVPNIDIRHENAFTRQRMTKDQFRSENSRRGWTEAGEVPGWGITKDRFYEFLNEHS
jgi:hypothetical protein